MKILAIRGKNLASLQGKFEIDFTQEPLSHAGIFAITGSTGAGKSTILDALCVALFDATPRTSKGIENLQITETQDRTINIRDSRNILRRGTAEGYAEVDFVALDGEHYRSNWYVNRANNKINGKLQSTRIRLINLTSGSEIYGGKTELLSRITELLGLNFNQFTRAVLLAQGDFATFMKASQGEKAELLEKLTGTDIYSKISSSIFEKRKSTEQELNLVNEKIKGIEILSPDEIKELKQEKKRLSVQIERLNKDWETMQEQYSWSIKDAQLEKSVAESENISKGIYQSIEKAKPRFHYIELINLVQEIRDNHISLQSYKKELTKNTSLSERYLREIKELKDKSEQIKLTGNKENETLKTLQSEYEKTEPLIKQARDIDVRITETKKNLDETDAELIRIRQSYDKKKENAHIIKDTIDKNTRKEKALEEWFEQRGAYIGLVTQNEHICRLLQEIDKNEKSKILLEKDIKLYSEHIETGNKTLQNLQEKIENLNKKLPVEIAILRAKLTDGKPCPVCGSVHHPIQMSPDPEHILEESAIEKEKQETTEAIEQLKHRIELWQNECIETSTLLKNFIGNIKEKEQEARHFLSILPNWEKIDKTRLQEKIKTLSLEWEKYGNSQNELKEKTAKLSSSLDNEQENLKTLSEDIKLKENKKAEIDTHLSLLFQEQKSILNGKSAEETEIFFKKRISDSFSKKEELSRTLNEIKSTLKNSEGAYKQLMTENKRLTKLHDSAKITVDNWLENKKGIISGDLLEELLSLDPEWISKEKKELENLRNDEISITATCRERKRLLDEHRKSKYKIDREKTLEIANYRLKELQNALQNALKRIAEIDTVFCNREKNLEQIRLYEKELKEKEHTAENWKKLDILFGSADGAKFKKIAQGYTLDVLLGYANKHLQDLTQRYELQRIGETLALQVCDKDMLGEVRSVHSLSGGESFLISLALALGLSSLSSNRMNVESLFIDEGFGSLDSETLSIAMDALERLQTQGRKIGVISHVQEMNERIAVQIQVTKSANRQSKIRITG